MKKKWQPLFNHSIGDLAGFLKYLTEDSVHINSVFIGFSDQGAFPSRLGPKQNKNSLTYISAGVSGITSII